MVNQGRFSVKRVHVLRNGSPKRLSGEDATGGWLGNGKRATSWYFLASRALLGRLRGKRRMLGARSTDRLRRRTGKDLRADDGNDEVVGALEAKQLFCPPRTSWYV